MIFTRTFLSLALAGGLLAGGRTAAAQAFPVPAAYSFPAKADYARYDAQIIETVDWFEQTLDNEQPNQHRAANQFLIHWLTGTPAV